MKTTKFLLIAALLLISALSFTQADQESGQFSVKISLKAAIHNPNLVWAMYDQLNQDFLIGTQKLPVYTATVKYRQSLYVIYGTYQEWVNFFVMDYNNLKNKLSPQE
jgi:hypothetical protein